MVERGMAEINIGRWMFRADRLWAYLKYVQATLILITTIYATGWPWWLWAAIIGAGLPLAVFVMWLDKTRIYPGYSDAAFKHLQEEIKR